MHVPTAKLASNTIPHRVAARTLLGQPDRILMGVVVISGLFGAATALLYATRRMIGRLAETSISINNFKHIRITENGTLIFIAGATVLSMAVFTNCLNRDRRLVARSIDTKRDSSLNY